MGKLLFFDRNKTEQNLERLTAGELFKLAVAERNPFWSERLYLKAVEKDPNPGFEASCTINRGTLQFELGNYQKAAELYQLAVELNPNCIEGWYNLGNVLDDLGRSVEAAESYYKGLELDNSCANIHFNLAIVLTQLGKEEVAELHWKQYLTYGTDKKGRIVAQDHLKVTYLQIIKK